MKSDDPLLPGTCLHCKVVFPIDINTVQIVANDKISQSISGSKWISTSGRWKLCWSKSRNQYLFASVIKSLFELFLNSLGIIADPRKVCSCIGPSEGNVCWAITEPKGQGDVVVRQAWPISRHTNAGNKLVTPPSRNGIHIHEVNWVWNCWICCWTVYVRCCCIR